jgi:hypothetical protein
MQHARVNLYDVIRAAISLHVWYLNMLQVALTITLQEPMSRGCCLTNVREHGLSQAQRAGHVLLCLQRQVPMRFTGAANASLIVQAAYKVPV